MFDRDEALAFLGLPAGAGLSEIVRAYAGRSAAAGARLSAGDESARVELAALSEAYERLTGRSPGRRPSRLAQNEGGAERTGTGQMSPAPARQRTPAWWESYLSLLLALASLAAFVVLVVYLPHVYRKGGVLVPLGLLTLALFLSIVATMVAAVELRYGFLGSLFESGELDSGFGQVLLRRRVARIANLLSRIVRWLVVLGLIATVFLNFASLSGRWSLRR
jgi:hypothetical protein